MTWVSNEIEKRSCVHLFVFATYSKALFLDMYSIQIQISISERLEKVPQVSSQVAQRSRTTPLGPHLSDQSIVEKALYHRLRLESIRKSREAGSARAIERGARTTPASPFFKSSGHVLCLAKSVGKMESSLKAQSVLWLSSALLKSLELFDPVYTPLSK